MPHAFTTRDRPYRDTLGARLFTPEGPGPFPAVIDIHGGAWCGGDLGDGQSPQRNPCRSGLLRGRDQFPSRRGRLPDLARRHQLRHPLGQGARRGAPCPPRPCRAFRQLQRWASRHAGRHAPARSALRRHPTSDRHQARRCLGQRGRHALAGHQSALTLPPRSARPRQRQPAALGRRHPGAPRSLLAWRGGHVRRQPDAGAGAWRDARSPPALWVQGRPDDAPHDYHDPEGGFPGNEPERFAANYRRAGGSIELVHVDQATRATGPTLDHLVAFFIRHLRHEAGA